MNEPQFHDALMERLEAIKEARGLTVGQAAEFAGVRRRSWQLWRRGGSPSAYHLYRFMKAAKLRWKDLMPDG